MNLCKRHLLDYVAESNCSTSISVGDTYTIVAEQSGLSSKCVDCAEDASELIYSDKRANGTTLVEEPDQRAGGASPLELARSTHDLISLREITIEDCAACNLQQIDEHCLEHHFLARGTKYEKCQEGCCDTPPCEYCFVEEPAPPPRLVSGYRITVKYHNGHTAVVTVEAGSLQDAISKVDPAYWDDPQMSGFKATQCTWMEE
jgi:hypothetical protein